MNLMQDKNLVTKENRHEPDAGQESGDKGEQT